MSENNLDRIYEEFGANICLFPFFAAFYQSFGLTRADSSFMTTSTVVPCSVYSPPKNNPKNNNLIIDNNIIKTINSSEWKDLRKNFIEKSCHDWEQCITCSNAERGNGNSPRQLNNEYFADHLEIDIIEEINQIINNDYQVDKILSLDFFPSSYCNYECIMCTGGSSTTRLVFENRKEDKRTQQLFKITPNLLANDFNHILKNVKMINFAGGETILQKQVHEVIDYLIAQNLAKDITITLLTNASRYPTKLLEKFKQFKNVFYTISIDGIGDVIEYQRRGSIWTEVEMNSLLIYQNFGAVINYVLTAVSVFGVIDFLAWVNKNNIDKLILSLVFYFDHLSLSVIPPEMKNKLIDKLISQRSQFNGKYLDFLDRVIEALGKAQWKSDLLPKFIEHINNEDTASKKLLIDVVPEWRPYFG